MKDHHLGCGENCNCGAGHKEHGNHHSKMKGFCRRGKHKLVGLVVLLVIIFFFPFHKINWGTLNLGSQSTISVIGSADGTQKNQIASFRASVSIEGTDKEAAVQEVNTKMTKLINSLKEFGIEEDDLETQRVSTYETDIDDGVEITIFPPRPKNRIKGWRASNSVSITLRDIEKTSGLADLLTGSGATDISGPNFRVDDVSELEKELLQEALDDAKEKAKSMLGKSGQKVGKIIRLSEGSGGGNYRLSGLAMDAMLPEAGGGVPAPIETGSQKITKTVTVVFEIK